MAADTSFINPWPNKLNKTKAIMSNISFELKNINTYASNKPKPNYKVEFLLEISSNFLSAKAKINTAIKVAKEYLNPN